MYAKQQYEELQEYSYAVGNNRIYSSYSELDILADVCCEVFGITYFDFIDQRRFPVKAECRQVFFFMARNFTDEYFTIQQISDFVGGRHHTTALSGEGKIMDLLDIEDEMIDKCLDILDKFTTIRKWQH